MRVRGFSVIEVVVATGVLALIVALVLPAVLGRAVGRPIDGVARDLESALWLARAEASESGRPLAVRCRETQDGGGWVLERAMVADAEAFDSWAEAGEELSRGAGDTGSDLDEMRWRPLAAIPVEFVASAEAPSVESVGVAGLEEAPSDAEVPEAFVLGVFLPTGRCAGAGRLFLTPRSDDDSAGDGIELVISAWTGRVRTSPWRAETGDLFEAPSGDAENADGGIPEWLSAPGDAGVEP